MACICVDGIYSVEERVGRQLAVIGDEVDAQYAGLFNKMIDSLSLSENTLYGNFAAIARQSVLFSIIMSFTHLSLSVRLSLSLCLSVCLSVML